MSALLPLRRRLVATMRRVWPLRRSTWAEVQRLRKARDAKRRALCATGDREALRELDDMYAFAEAELWDRQADLVTAEMRRLATRYFVALPPYPAPPSGDETWDETENEYWERTRSRRLLVLRPEGVEFVRERVERERSRRRAGWQLALQVSTFVVASIGATVGLMARCAPT